MNQSESITALAKALIAVQGELTPVTKDRENPFFHSKYVGLDTVMPMALALLNKHGLALTQTIGNGGHDGGSSLTTMLLHTSGEYLADTAPLLLVKNDPQSQGSAVTYARRYGLMSLLGIVAESDDDGNAASAPSAPRTPPAQQYADSGRAQGEQMAQEYSERPPSAARRAESKYEGDCYVCGEKYRAGETVYYKQVSGKWVRWHLACDEGAEAQ